MPAFKETLKFLYDLQLFGIKVGLINIRGLCEAMGNPERSFPTIHIAGTNGKGSTAAMIASILTASGYRTGLYTSPHLIAFNERIRIDGVPISDDALVQYTSSLKPAIRRLKATFFEATTAIAFKYFADRHVDIAVIETGLGGRLDATNVLTPLLSIITNIGLDHTEYLGTTLAQIAGEKGGIIKAGIPCLTAVQEPSALRTLKRIATTRRSPLIHIDDVSTVIVHSNSLAGLDVSLKSRNSSLATHRSIVRRPLSHPRNLQSRRVESSTTISTSRLRPYGSVDPWGVVDRNPKSILPNLKSPIPNLFLSLPGLHQTRNLQIALAAVELLRQRHAYKNISVSKTRDGLTNIRRYSGLRGRLDVIHRSPVIVADVAHNPAGMATLVRALEQLIPGKCVVVFGVMKDKDYRLMARELARVARLTVAVRPETGRALSGSVIVSVLHDIRSKAIDGGTVRRGVSIAAGEAREADAILITGSHYVVGEALATLHHLS